MQTVFVTSSGTEIGKTFISSLLIRQLKARGLVVEALKPVISGFTAQTCAQSDTACLLAALGKEKTQENIEALSPWRFEAALSPDMAAKREGRSLSFDELVAFCVKKMENQSDVLLIEGVGGVMVPLDETHLVCDWMHALDVQNPVKTLLVVGSYLGTVSHTLTALQVLHAKNLVPRSIIVSQSEESPVPLEETCATIARFAGAIPVVSVPRLEKDEAGPDLAAFL